MTDKQLAVLLTTKVTHLQDIKRDLFTTLEATHGEERKYPFGGTYTVVPVLDDLSAFIDQTQEEIEILLQPDAKQ